MHNSATNRIFSFTDIVYFLIPQEKKTYVFHWMPALGYGCFLKIWITFVGKMNQEFDWLLANSFRNDRDNPREKQLLYLHSDGFW